MRYILATTNKFLKHPNFFRPSISLYLNVLLPLQKICTVCTIPNNLTERYCTTPFTANQRTDSITFTRTDKTFHYFYTLRDEADNAEIINQHKASLKQALQDDLDKNTQSKAYKDAGFRFHYVFRSGKTAKVLFEQTLKGKH